MDKDDTFLTYIYKKASNIELIAELNTETRDRDTLKSVFDDIIRWTKEIKEAIDDISGDISDNMRDTL